MVAKCITMFSSKMSSKWGSYCFHVKQQTGKHHWLLLTSLGVLIASFTCWLCLLVAWCYISGLQQGDLMMQDMYLFTRLSARHRTCHSVHHKLTYDQSVPLWNSPVALLQYVSACPWNQLATLQLSHIFSLLCFQLVSHTPVHHLHYLHFYLPSFFHFGFKTCILPP